MARGSGNVRRLRSPPLARPKAATLVDPMHGSSLNATLWVGNGTISESASGLLFTNPASYTGYTNIVSNGFYDMTGSSFSVRVVDPGLQSIFSWEIQLQVQDATNANNLQFLLNKNSLLIQYKVAGATTNPTFLSYNPALHKYWRIREAGGTTFWDWSTDGLSWTNIYSHANVIPVTALQAKLTAGTYNAETTATTVTYDNFGVVPVPPALATLTDTFPGTTLDLTKWGPQGGTYAVASNRLGLAITSGYSAVLSNTYSLIGSSIVAQLTPSPVGGGTNQLGITCAVAADGSNSLGAIEIFIGGGKTTAAWDAPGNVEHDLASPACLGGTGPTWVRISESGGTVFWDQSADGITWTNITSLADPISGLGAVRVSLWGGHYGAETDTTAYVANVNTPPVVPALSTLTDAFPGTTLDTTKWAVMAGTVTVSNGLGLLATTSYSGIASKQPYALSNSSIYWQTTPLPVGAGTYEAAVSLAPTAGGNTNAIEYEIAGNHLAAMWWDGSGFQQGLSTLATPASPCWLRIREASGTTYFDWSADGASWTNWNSFATPVPAGSMYVTILAGRGAADPNTTAFFADVNVTPAVPVALTASAAGVAAAVSATTAPSKLTPAASAVAATAGAITAPAKLTPTASVVALATATAVTASALLTGSAQAAGTVTASVRAAAVLTGTAQAAGAATLTVVAVPLLIPVASALAQAAAATTAASGLTTAAQAQAQAQAAARASARLTATAQDVTQAALTLLVPGVAFLTASAQASAQALSVAQAAALLYTTFVSGSPYQLGPIYYAADGLYDMSLPVDLSGTNAVTLVFAADYQGGDGFGGMLFEYTVNINATNNGFWVSPGSEWGTAGAGEITNKYPDGGYNLSEFPRPPNGPHTWCVVIDRSVGVHPTKIWIDGEPHLTTIYGGFSDASTDNFPNDVLYIGHRYGGSENLPGGVSMPLVFPYAFTDTAAQQASGASSQPLIPAAAQTQATLTVTSALSMSLVLAAQATTSAAVALTAASGFTTAAQAQAQAQAAATAAARLTPTASAVASATNAAQAAALLPPTAQAQATAMSATTTASLITPSATAIGSATAPLTSGGISFSPVAAAAASAAATTTTTAPITGSAQTTSAASATVIPVVTLVQKLVRAEQSTASPTVQLTNPTTSGNALLVGIALYSSDGGANEIDMAAVNPVTDGGTNTFVPIASGEVKQPGTHWYQHIYWYLARDIVGKATEIVTCNFQRATFSFVTVWEFTPAMWSQATTNTGVGTTPSAGSLTPPTNGAQAAMIVTFDGTGTFTPPAGWIVDRNDSAGGGTTENARYPETTAAAVPFSETVTSSAGSLIWAVSGITLVLPVLAPVAVTASARMVAGAVMPVTAAAQLPPAAGAVALAAATVTTTAPLTASSTAIASAVVPLTAGGVGIAPAVTALAAAVLSPTAPSLLTPSAAAVGQPSALVTASARLIASAQAISQAAAPVTASTIPFLAASAIGIGQAQAQVRTTAPLIAAAQAVSQAASAVTSVGIAYLVPVAQGSAQAAVTLTAKAVLSASAQAASSAAAQATAPAQLAAAAQASAAAGVALLSAPVRLAPVATAAGQATLAVLVPGVTFFAPVASAQSQAAATVTAPQAQMLAPVAQATATVGVALRTPALVSPVAQGVAAAQGLTTVAQPLTALLVAQAAAQSSATAAAQLSVNATGVTSTTMSSTAVAQLAPAAVSSSAAGLVVRTAMLLAPAGQAAAAASALVVVPVTFTANATARAATHLIITAPASAVLLLPLYADVVSNHTRIDVIDPTATVALVSPRVYADIEDPSTVATAILP